MQTNVYEKAKRYDGEKLSPLALEISSGEVLMELLRTFEGKASGLCWKEVSGEITRHERDALQEYRGLYIQVAQRLGVWDRVDFDTKLKMGLYQYVKEQELEKASQEANPDPLYGLNRCTIRARYYLALKRGQVGSPKSSRR